MTEKNQIVCAVTEGLGSNGEGIIRHEGVTFFVPYFDIKKNHAIVAWFEKG